MRRRLCQPAAVLLSAIALAGCGLSNPYATSTAHPAAATSTAATVTDADPVPERGGTIPQAARKAQSKLAAGAAQSSPRAALARYARLYINWTAATVASVQRELATISLDQARAQALQAAASYARDSTLLKSHVANSGQVVSIAPGQGPATGDWVIVTSETTTGQGDYQGLPAQLEIAYAQLTHTSTGWVVSSWEPQP